MLEAVSFMGWHFTTLVQEGREYLFLSPSVFPFPSPFKRKEGREEEVQEGHFSLWAMKILWVSDLLGIKTTPPPKKNKKQKTFQIFPQKFWNEMEIYSSETSSLDFSTMLKTCMHTAARDTSLDDAVTRTEAD